MKTLLPALAAILALYLPAADAHAGRPANGYFYFTFSRDFAGDNIGKVEWNWDGQRNFTMGTPTTYPKVTSIHGLVYTWDNHLLITGKQKDQVYRIKPGDKEFTTTTAPWKQPEHIFVEPSLKSAWITDNSGKLFQAPLDPYGKVTEVRPGGSEKGINTISYKDAATAWYTQSTLFDSSRIGELDPRTMETRRTLSISTFIHDARYDPFTGHVVMCGDKTLSQYDPESKTIVSKRVFTGVSQLYSCVVDGEGRMILSSWNGFIYFIDYSATGKIGDPANATDSTYLVDGMFSITPLIGPGSPPIVKRPFYVGTHGVYRDNDGDGRIDGVQMEFKAAVYDPPGLIHVSHPQDPAAGVQVDSAHILKQDFTHFMLDLKDRQFPFGTTCKPGSFAKILRDASLFGADNLPLTDGVGPQAIKAETRPPQNKGDKPWLDVTYSEKLRIDLAVLEFPFKLKRAIGDPNGLVKVESIKDLGRNKYRYTFSSEEFPLLGDSLKLIPALPHIADTLGNLNNMSIWIPVGGYPFPVFSILPEKFPSLVSYGNMGSPAPAGPAVLVVDPSQDGGLCLNCPDARIGAALTSPVTDPAVQGFSRWLMTVTIQGPMRYTLNFYSTLGEFVNTADAVIDVNMIRRMRPDKQGRYTVRLYWWPTTAMGLQAGTGAYIVRGTLSGDGLKNPLLQSSTEVLSLPKKSEKITATFGYLRR